ncbi:MAG TPA: DoxX family protein [Tepidisphaeraceae bacterium]|jgi:putative oxidoreductase|nr:DoxX family protein [Tepidisphaeraceae bacterium]
MATKNKIVKAYEVFRHWAGPIVLSLFLLLIRIVWGYQFFIAGRGKLGDIDKPIGFFRDLGIPMPVANAWLVACVECFGGLMLLAGLLSRPVAIALTINMTVAYLTADNEAVKALFKDGDVSKFSQAAPFWFLVTSVIVLALGPGIFSIDAICQRLFFSGTRHPDGDIASNQFRQ